MTEKKAPEFEDISSEVYPERGKQKAELSLGENFAHIRCKSKIASALKNSPLVKLMLSALKSKGCIVDADKQIVVENCSEEVTGGYDFSRNQIVVCRNRVYSEEMAQSVIGHELLHMFDFCRAKVDFANNLEHIACSEIRAANLMHCSEITSLFSGTTSPLNVAATHKECVKAKAIASILSVRKNFPILEALEIVDKVFDRCYNDLEPMGRRPRLNSLHLQWAYRERFHYDYDQIS